MTSILQLFLPKLIGVFRFKFNTSPFSLTLWFKLYYSPPFFTLLLIKSTHFPFHFLHLMFNSKDYRSKEKKRDSVLFKIEKVLYTDVFIKNLIHIRQNKPLSSPSKKSTDDFPNPTLFYIQDYHIIINVGLTQGVF